jgi:nicotinamidase-related amidase
MPAWDSSDLHGSAPDSSRVALLIIDAINDLEFEGSDRLLRFALPMAGRVAALKARARAHGVPCIYVNDNFGRWRSNFQALFEHCLDDGVKGASIARLLRPSEEDYFVVKPKHSGFYATPLELVLEHLGARTLILTGMAANLCVLYTANDAYMRDYRLVVPADCVASETEELNAQALEHMRTFLKAQVLPSSGISLGSLGEGADKANRALGDK